MKIPDDRKPSYEVTINGVKNFFAPGTEVSGDVASALFGTENFPPVPPETDKPFNIPIPAPGSTVSANPTLAGTEDSLTGLEIDGTKYKVGGSSGGGVLVVNLSENYVCDKTAGEMLAAMETVGVVIKIAFPDDTTIMPVIGGYGKSSGFGFGVETDDGILHFTAETENGYPVLQSDGGD